MKLKLWKLSQEHNNGYETFDSAVVVAASFTNAVLLHPAGDKIQWNGSEWVWADDGTDFGMNSWVNPDNVTVQHVGEAGPGLEEGDVICASYWSG